jgi:hypothetical protein
MSFLEFATGHHDLVGIYNDHELAGVDVWGVLGSMFAHQNGGDFSCQATENLVVRVHNVPFLLNLTWLGHGGCFMTDDHS